MISRLRLESSREPAVMNLSRLAAVGDRLEGGYRTVIPEHFQSGMGGGKTSSGLPGHLHQPF
ncbi:hypothetical protein NXV33_20995 [Bacteroides thetaiotaomicron]|nr:hypothetical protein [Bacteroides thetaiotaomicron]